MTDYKQDTTTIISDWDQLVSIRRNSLTYNDRGEPINSWALVVSAYMDIQPASFIGIANMEAGMKEKTSHIAFGYYNTVGVKIDIWIGDRIYDIAGKVYEVLSVNEFNDSHFEISCMFVEGADGTPMSPSGQPISTDWQSTFLKNKYDGDDVTTVFATTYKFISGSTLVFVDGVLKEEGVGKDYTENANHLGITFNVAPYADNKIEIRYIQDLV